MSAQPRIVLVEPSHPGNVGAAARAMKTMGLTRLYLVAPQCFPHAEASARASGADDVLAAAVVCEDLGQALQGCGLCVGTSARQRSLAWPGVEPRECARLLNARSGDSAVVFGRERTGLSNDELQLCHYMLRIPSVEHFSSLNLAAAVQIVAYEWRLAASSAPAPAPGEAPASFELLQGFYAHLEQTLVAIGYLDPANPGWVMPRLRRLFNRALLEPTEVDLLRGICKAAQRHR